MESKGFSLIKNRKLYNGLLLVIFTATLFFITIYKLEDNKLDLKIGDVSTLDIRATKDLEDIYTTERLKKEAMEKVEPRYRISPSVQMSMKAIIKEFLDTTRDIKAQENISLNKRAQLLQESSKNIELNVKEAYTAIGMDYKTLNNFENIIMDLITQVMGNGVREAELQYEKENIVNTFDSLDMKEEAKQLGIFLIHSTMEANEFLDKIETERRQLEESEKIDMVILKENDIIAHQGSIIRERELELVRASGLLKEDNKIPIGTIVGTITLLLLGVSIIFGYIYLFNKEILYNNRLLILLMIMLSSIIICKEMAQISPYIMPLATVPILISMIVEPKLGLIVNIFISLFLGFMLNLDSGLVTMYMVSGSMASLIAIKQEQRYNILINGAIVGLINILTLTSFRLAKGIGGIDSASIATYSLINGILAAILTLGSLPIWENVFSVLTTLKLLELSNPNHPLLKKLLLEAPGTYHHSILVGNLAEGAADAISANSLLARVASYYHDIGKTARPYYFAENQFGIENPHNKLQPMQSTTIITSHTTDGIAMAREKKLPKEIIDIIEEHHGDTAVAYFYYKAKELDQDIDISIDEFRYKGKKPQTKESAIVMLADSSEAAVRSMKDLTKEKIEEMVRKIVQGKLKDGQLDESDLTLKDIEAIVHSFVKVLTGIYHDRIEYPNTEEKLEA